MYPTFTENLKISYVEAPPKNVDSALFERPHLKVSEEQFFLQIYNQAQFYVEKGEHINIYLEEGADIDSVHLFLNGSVLGSVLLQKKILAFHGSSFRYKEHGVIICGRAGAGKSSVTAAFCQNEAQFITDDITPISIAEEQVYINALKTEIKLWDDALEQLNLSSENLKKIRPTLNKFYYPCKHSSEFNSVLHIIILLETHNMDEFSVSELIGIGKFNALKNQVYRKIYLKGMPQTEQHLCRQLLNLGPKIKVLQITRPQICSISRTKNYIKQKIDELLDINNVSNIKL